MSLSKKIILLLVLPAVFQLCLLAAVTKLQQKAEEEARAAQKAMHLASLVNSISNEIFFLASVNNGEGSFYRPLISNQDLFNRYDAVGASFAELKTLVKDDPEKLHETLETEEILNKSFKLIKNLRQNWMETGPSGAMERAPLWVELVNLGTSHIFTHFKKFGEEQSLQAEQGPEKQRSLRELTMMVILVLGGLTFFSTGLSGAYLLRGVTRRLDTMRDNALRLASNRPLNPPLPGQDEIAELDSTFHQMAQSLKQARRKEQAIIENANDIICSLGPDLRVLSINPAILTVLGFAPEEVEGMNFKQLVEPANQAQVGEYMQGLIEQKPSQPLEVKMLTASGESVFTLWSVLWSFEE
ncbi:MAG: PAS domain S-box protein, partial [Bdellovibrionales bacterium]|nr:PAS domain S-box protein [Bdellovibrionales bacterium]